MISRSYMVTLIKYYLIENNIKYLLGDNMLREVEGGIVCLSNKGFGAIEIIKSSGYLAKWKEDCWKTTIKYIVYTVSISIFGILIYKTFILDK